ncbi:MAG: hypothetical protein PHQ74_01995 [Crocinitomicaceae bacterium]|nr:hypothetical protein [Crocinitomicaceae bacterium]
MTLRANLIITALVLIILPIPLQAQFTYLDISLGNRFTNISGDKNFKTKYDQTNIQINGLWRFKRYFGIGATASVPVREGGTYRLKVARKYQPIVIPHSYGQSNLDFKYYFTESTKVAFNGRIYGGIKGNFYLDGRISMFSMTENLSFTNLGKKYSETNKFSQIAPGFSVGLNPHLGKYLHMNLNLSWDFYTYKDIGFKNGNTSKKDTYYIESAESNIGSFKFKSQVIEKATTFSFNFGLGYKF